jgi:hypothetical protein
VEAKQNDRDTGVTGAGTSGILESNCASRNASNAGLNEFFPTCWWVPIHGFLRDGNDPEDGKMFAIGLGVLLIAIALTAFSIVLHRKSQLPKSTEEQIALPEREIIDADATLAKLEQFSPPSGDLKSLKRRI